MLAIFGFATNSLGQADIEAISRDRAETLDRAFLAMLERHHVNTAGAAVLKNGILQWQSQYGWQSPETVASEKTLFNMASITKTVTAETILRLVNQGRLSLDEPMSLYWVDPDLEDSPQLRKLTARMALTHTSGFMNWRFFSDDNKLDFIHEPGTEFGYSGEGFQYLRKYAENKLGTTFEELVKTTLFEPLGMEDVSICVRKANFSRIAKPLGENGAFFGYYCYPHGYCRQEGDCSAAGDMVVSITDYAKFLTSSMRGEGLSEALMQERDSLHVTSYEIDCVETPNAICPTRLGYGLGWNITQLANDKLIGHSGSDWSTVSLAYYYLGSGDGLIIVFNAPNQAGIAAMVDALMLLDPDSPKLHEYKARLARFSE